MTRPYRLAVIRADAADLVMAERDGRMVPLHHLLTAEDRARLGQAALSDIMPLLAEWPHWRDVLPDRIAAGSALLQAEGVTAQAVRFRPPIASPRKLICIGANYHDHIEEMKIPMLPDYPYAFLKPPSTTLRGSGDEVVIPAIARMVDWEAELAVVIGTPARDVAAENALDFVAGYANLNDLSARDWLANRPGVGVDWVRHKAFDGFAPMGPYFLPAQFVADPHDLPIRLTVNGVVKQESNTGQMVHGVHAIIAHLSTIMTLEPGDVIATGTPAGCGHGRDPQEFLGVGDEIRIEIGELGELVTHMVSHHG